MYSIKTDIREVKYGAVDWAGSSHDFDQSLHWVLEVGR